MEGNWDGYTDAEMRIPGHDVTNITIEDTVVSTSISNTVRVGWPKKTFRSAHVTMRNLDVIHTGFGGCVVPFAFFELWADELAQGEHTDFLFSNIRLEDFYSLMQIRYPNPRVEGVVFSNVSALDGPAMVPSVLQGNVSGVVLDGVRVTGKVATSDADIPIEVSEGAAEPEYRSGSVDASFDYGPGVIRPGAKASFQVLAPAAGWRYEWLFGDGTTAVGSRCSMLFLTLKERCSTVRGGFGFWFMRREPRTMKCGFPVRWWWGGSRLKQTMCRSRWFPESNESTPDERWSTTAGYGFRPMAAIV